MTNRYDTFVTILTCSHQLYTAKKALFSCTPTQSPSLSSSSSSSSCFISPTSREYNGPELSINQDYPLSFIQPEEFTDENIQLFLTNLQQTLIEQIAPAIQSDGNIHLISYDPDAKIISVALTGACESCDRSAVTLQILVSNALKHYYPDYVNKVVRSYLPHQTSH
jgi:Fe-S cluster biogenesis protein NfuA